MADSDNTLLLVALGVGAYLLYERNRQQGVAFTQRPVSGGIGTTVTVPGFGSYQAGPGGTQIQLDPRLFGQPAAPRYNQPTFPAFGDVAGITPSVPQAPAFPEYPPSDSPLWTTAPEDVPTVPMEPIPSPADWFPPDLGMPDTPLDPCLVDPWACGGGYDWTWMG